MVKSMLTDVEFDEENSVRCVELELTQNSKHDSNGEYNWRHGAGRKKKRLPKKGRKKSSVFVNKVMCKIKFSGRSNPSSLILKNWFYFTL